MQIKSTPEPYDAIVVGSGATGGVAAKTLAERGLKVLVLEAGRAVDPKAELGNTVKDLTKRFYNLALARRQSFQATHPGYWKANPDFFVDETENPYTTPDQKPFYWMRGRQVGGRSLTWGGITLRFSDYEFKAASRDGFGDDWPISYADLTPYYDHLERFFQVRGARDGLPQLPDGQYLPPSPLTPAEQHLQQVVATHWPDRQLIVSRGFPKQPLTPENPWPRSASQGGSLQAALATGNVEVRSDAIASHVLFDPDTHRARGIGYLHRLDKTTHEVYARLVVLCASTIESVRLLLHSTEAYQPGGLVNESGLLGRYLMDHVSTTQFFWMPQMDALKPPFPLSGSESFFIPNFCNLAQPSEPFLRGYGLWGGIQRFEVPTVLKKVGEGALGFLIGHGEVLPRYENHVRLDMDVADAWGIPAAHIDCAWSDNEHQMVAHMRSQIQATVEQAGGECRALTDLFYFPGVGKQVQQMEKQVSIMAPPGYYIHEVGGARMGHSPQNSVLNARNQCWEAPNLLVTDGACWVTAGWQSPTLTMMAITARACDLAVDDLKQGEI